MPCNQNSSLTLRKMREILITPGSFCLLSDQVIEWVWLRAILLDCTFEGFSQSTKHCVSASLSPRTNAERNSFQLNDKMFLTTVGLLFLTVVKGITTDFPKVLRQMCFPSLWCAGYQVRGQRRSQVRHGAERSGRGRH